MKLHLGCSNDIKPGWLNVDVYPPEKLNAPAGVTTYYQQFDLADPWPWPTSSVDVILAHEVFEHIGDCQHVGRQSCPVCQAEAAVPRVERAWKGKVHVMNEAWRVLKPGGILDMTVPCLHLANGNLNRAAFSDPTHATWWTLDDQFYYSDQFNREVTGWGGLKEQGERQRMGADYGIQAVFRFPWMRQREDRTWEADPGAPRGMHVWRAVDYAGGQRAKLQGIIEAVK